MRYLSLCSGIEAATVAWKPLGWEAVAFAEIEPFPCTVLAHHYPNVPNLGDIQGIKGENYRGTVDLLVGGTPCQDFSAAGKRSGLAGKRSGLALQYVRILSEIRPAWFLWENVPGAFSTNRGRDFGTLLKTLAECGYGLAWRVLDAQWFGVPQRRRRIFLIGYLGDWRPAAAVLFEPESLQWNFTQGRKARQDIAATLKGGSGNRGWESGCECNYIRQVKSHWEGGPHPSLTARENGGGIGMSDQEIFSQGGACLVGQENMAYAMRTSQTSSNGCGIAEDVAYTLEQTNGQCICYAPEIVRQAMSSKWAKGSSGPAGDEHHNLVCMAFAQNARDEVRFIGGDGQVAGALAANEGMKQRTYLALPTYPINTQVALRHQALGERTGLGIGEMTDPAYTLQAGHSHTVAYGYIPQPNSTTGTLCASGAGTSRPAGICNETDMLCLDYVHAQTIAFAERGREQGRTLEYSREKAYCLTNPGGGGRAHSRQILTPRLQVRRLTPRECERLQGFPDDYTMIEYRGKPACDNLRYKVLGNSMCVNVMRWIGQRIDMIQGQIDMGLLKEKGSSAKE